MCGFRQARAVSCRLRQDCFVPEAQVSSFSPAHAHATRQAPPRHRQAPPRRTGLHILTIVSFAVPVVAYLWFVSAYGLNTIWQDQWSDLALIQHAYSGHLTLSALWSQHTENRLLFPNLVVLALAKTTRFNVVDEELLSAIILVVATALLIVGHRRRSAATPYVFYLPAAIVMLSFGQYGNTLWGFQLAWYLVLLALSVALVLLDSPRWSSFVAAGAIIAGIVASYSSIQGLLVWPAGLVVLLLRRRPRRFALVWTACGVVTAAIYFVNYDSHLGGTYEGYVLHHPLGGLRFFFFSVGNVIDAHGGNLAVVLGVLIVVTALWLVTQAVFRSPNEDASALGVGLICLGLLFAALITVGRAGAGLDAGGASRYTTFDLLTVVGCYFVILSRRSTTVGERRYEQILWYWGVVVVGLSVCLTLVLGTVNGLRDARPWQNTQKESSRVIANIRMAPDSMVERLYGDYYFVGLTRQLAAFARVNRLTLFGSPSAVGRFVRAGLPYDPHSLTTTVVDPHDGESLHGVVLLIALAEGDFGVTMVDFSIGRPTGIPVRVSAGTTRYGWIAEWNSADLPDGKYGIRSVAYDHAYHQAQSEAVVVNVRN